MLKKQFLITVLIIIFSLFIGYSCSKPKKEFNELSGNKIYKEQENQIYYFSLKWLNNYQNITTIGGGLLFGSTEICDESFHVYDIGLKVANIYTVPSNLASSLIEILKLDDYLTVVSIENNSPAKNIGIEIGDKIISINEIELFGEYAFNNYESVIDRDLLKKYKIKLKRNGELEIVTVQSKVKCGFNVNVNFDNNQFNAWVDEYGNLTFSLRLADWLKKDELSTAVIMSHEIAHIVLNHINIKKTNKKIARVIGLALDIGAYTSGINTSGKIMSIAEKIGVNQYSHAMEKEADYYGAYILAINNYDYTKASNFWRIFSIEVPDSIYSHKNSTHPSTAERFVLLEETIKEIKKKKDSNKPLIPGF